MEIKTSAEIRTGLICKKMSKKWVAVDDIIQELRYCSIQRKQEIIDELSQKQDKVKK